MKKVMTVLSVVVLVVWVIDVQATFVGAYYSVPVGEGTFGHRFDGLPPFPSDFSDSYAYFNSIYFGSGQKLYAASPGNTPVSEENAGWVVYKYEASDSNIITNVDLTLDTYRRFGTKGIKVLWTTNDYDGQSVPDESEWIDTKFPYHNDPYTVTFQPNSNKFFVAYKIWNVSSTYWYVQIEKDKTITTTVVPEPATIGLILMGVSGFICAHRRQ